MHKHPEKEAARQRIDEPAVALCLGFAGIRYSGTASTSPPAVELDASTTSTSPPVVASGDTNTQSSTLGICDVLYGFRRSSGVQEIHARSDFLCSVGVILPCLK